jgi:hypothetical protein
LTGIHLDVVYQGTRRDVFELHRVAGLDIESALGCHDLVTNIQAFGLKDIAAITVGVFDQANTAVTIRIVLDSGHGTFNTDFVTLEIDDAVELFGSGLAVARCDATVVVAASQSGDGASLYLVELEGVERTSVATLDPTRSHAKLTFDGAAASLMGTEGEGWAAVEKLFNSADVLFAWEQIAGSEAALEQAKEYAMGRYAFGRPIAGFQAIKHKLANVYVKNTLARSNGGVHCGHAVPQ